MGPCLATPPSPPVTVMVIGCGNSGKSTFLKQLKILYMNGFTNSEVQLWRELIHTHFLFGIQEIITCVKNHPSNDMIDLERYAPELEILSKAVVVGPKESQAARVLWNVTEQVVHDQNYQGYASSCNMDYFMGRLEDIVKEDYLPTNEDILRARQRTAGITEVTFPYNRNTLTIMDCGGQASERPKWDLVVNRAISCTYFASLPSYDTPNPLDPNKTNLDESLEVWDAVVKNPSFEHCSLTLILNKFDLFKEKISRGGFTKLFPDYKGDETNANDCATHISSIYKSRVPNDRAVYSHVTSAINTRMIEIIFEDMLTHILSSALRLNGFA